MSFCASSSDEALWRAICIGDAVAFERLFDRYCDLLYNFAFRRTARWDLAEEIVGLVFLEAWRQRDRVTTLNGSLKPWLLGVAANQIRRVWRQHERRERVRRRLHVVDTAEDHSAHVADRIDDERRIRAVLDLVDQLPEIQREILLLWAWEDLTYEEIAEALAVPIGTVRSRLSRAREHLRESEGMRRAHSLHSDDSWEPNHDTPKEPCSDGGR